MVRVCVWRALALAALCRAWLQVAGDSTVLDSARVSISTSSAQSMTPPMWLVLPLLLDVQPVLLRVDVRRHVPAQLQLFCRDHGLETTRCSGVIREALEDVVNFQRFCRNSGAQEALPGFMVAKNVLRDSETPGSGLWRQDDPKNIAVDLCGFVQQSVGVGERFDTSKCAQTIDKALALSFEWMLALTPCESRASEGGEVSSSELEAPDVSERLSIVERMIAALDFSPFKKGELPTSSFTEEETSDDLSFQSIEEGDAVAQSADSDFSASNSVEQDCVHVEENENAVSDLDTEMDDVSVGVVTSVDMEEGSTDDESTEDNEVQSSDTQDEIAVSSTEEISSISRQGQGDKQVEKAPLHAVDAEAPSKTEERRSAMVFDDVENSESSQDTISPKQVDTEIIELANRSRDTAYATLEPQQLDQMEGGLQPKKSWTVAVTLVLLLSIAYLCIDLLLIGVRRVASSLAKPQLYSSLLLQYVLLLLRGDQQSKLSSESSRGPFGPPIAPSATERCHEAEQSAHEDATSSESREEELGSTTASSGTDQLFELEQSMQEEGEDLSNLQLPDATTSSPAEILNADRLRVPEDLEGVSASVSSSEASLSIVEPPEVDTHDDDVMTFQVSRVAVPSSAEHLDTAEQFVSEMEEQQREPLSPTLRYGTDDHHLESWGHLLPEEHDAPLESQVPFESTTPSNADIQEQTELDNDTAVAVPEPESTIILHIEAPLPPLRSALLCRSHTPNFTCVAMALMVGKHAEFFHKTATTSSMQLSFGHQGLMTPPFLQSGREVLDLILQKHQRELVAARRIQRAWIAIRSRESSVQVSETGVRVGMLPPGFVLGKIKASASIFSLLSLQRRDRAQTRGAPKPAKPAGGFHRLVSNVLPPL